jgi:hypothetical protein
MQTDVTVDSIGSPGEVVAEITLGPSGSASIDLGHLGVEILPSEKLSIFAKVSSGAASEVSATLNWRELK